jgi:hypothetical protein
MIMSKPNRGAFAWRGAVVAALALLAGISGPVQASVVMPMSLETIAGLSGQVIVGRVAAVRSYWVDEPRQIVSEVTFEQVEYLKGKRADSGDAFTLVVPGGRVGEMQMRVCCAPSFEVGEKWLLFLLPEYRTFPTAGMWQGAFRIKADTDGTERVYRELHDELMPVTHIDADGFAVSQKGHCRRPETQARVVGGSYKSITVRAASREAPTAMSLVEFRAALEPVLERSKTYELTGPAGQRIPVEYTAVPLQAAVSKSGQEENRQSGALRGVGASRRSSVRPAGPDAEVEEVWP